MAVEHGIDGFIFDTYLGVKDGRPVHEMGNVLDETFMRDDVNNGLKFCVMAILASPRIALPVAKDGFREASRDYDMSKATIRALYT